VAGVGAGLVAKNFLGRAHPLEASFIFFIFLRKIFSGRKNFFL